ncbi:hypothetical protein BD414DRAFT_490079 [Trametes punicea]|nr:hypothetical protein BD414DRAFT_490079 [Trametes punicea]
MALNDDARLSCLHTPNVAMSSPASPSLPIAPRPLQLVDGNLQSPTISTCPSPTASGLSTPPPSAHNVHPRRQSSIAYFPSDHSPTWDLRSPTTASGSGSSLKRSTSLNRHPSERHGLKGDRRSLPASDVLASAQAERPPLTLTEKHADLLRFIAQKESKCLELRSQLAVHEAELAQLKRKWERIVSRGMDRAYAHPSGSSHSSSSLLSGAVKEGVQGVSRLLVAGLSDLSVSASSASKPEPSSALPRTPILPLRAGRRNGQGHATTQSTSSVSTATTSLTSSSVRLSQSSASSLANDDTPCETEEPESEPEVAVKRTSISVDGGTGIESPVEISHAKASRAAKLHRRKSREAPPSPSLAPLSSSPATRAFSDVASSSPPAMSGEAGGVGRSQGKAQEVYKKTIKRSSLHLAAGGSIPPAASIPGLGPLASPLASAWMGSVGSTVGKKWEELQKGETFAKSQKRASLLFSDVSSSILAALASPSSSSGPATPFSAPALSSVSVSTNPFAATLSPLSTSPAPPSPLSRSQPRSSPSAQSLLEDDDASQDGLGSVLVPDTKAPAHAPSASSPRASGRAPQSSKGGGGNEGKTTNLLDNEEDEDEWNW